MPPKPAAKKSPEKKPVPPPGANKRPGRPPSRGDAAGGKKGGAKVDVAEGPDPEEEENKPEDVMSYLSKLETQRLADNALLKKALRRSTSPVRTKIPSGYKAPPGGKAACITIQCSARMMLARRAMRTRRAITATLERRQRQTSLSPTRDEDENPVFRQLEIRSRVVPLKFQEEAQAAALVLQARIRGGRGRRLLGMRMVASAVIWRRIQAAQCQIPWRRGYATMLLEGRLRRQALREQLFSLSEAIVTLQAHARRRTIAEVRHQRRLWMRRRLQDAFKAHKMAMIREIKIRKEASVPVQAAMRRAIASKEYAVLVQETRDEEDRVARELASVMLLSTRARMALYRHSLVHDAKASNLLRRMERMRVERERYLERRAAAYELRRHFKAVAVQLSASNRLLMPLTRHAQAHRSAKRSACYLQSIMRVWLLNYRGQKSSVEMYGEKFIKVIGAIDEVGEGGDEQEKVGRIHLNFEQKREAARHLQRGVRRALAFTSDRSIEPSGYSAILEAAARLQAQVRGRKIRDMVLGLSEQYGAVVLQAQARMRAQNIAHRKTAAGYIRLSSSCKRALANRWYSETFEAQIRLQALGKMASTPEPGLYYSKLPSRKLSSILQARARMCLLSRGYAEQRLASLTMGAIVRARVYRMRYLSTKTWCQKAGGNQNDLHKLFGKLTSSMDKNGTPFWRKNDFVSRREMRSTTYGDGGTMGSIGSGTLTGVAPLTEKKRGILNEEERERSLLGQKESEGKALGVGLVLTELNIPIGTERVIVEGRLSKVLSESVVVLDELGTSGVVDCYRHFFLKNGKESRRIIKNTRDRVCTVVSPFGRRPVPDSQYTIMDLEEAPFEPNLVLLRRKKEFEAARCIQNRWRWKVAFKEFSALLREHRDRLEAIRAEEEYQAMLAAERERARLGKEAEDRARRAAIEEGKRLVALEQARQEAIKAAKKEAKRKQLEKLWGIKPNLPVPPARPFSPSPRAGQHISGVAPGAVVAPPRRKPPSMEELEEGARHDLEKSFTDMPPGRDVERFFNRPDAILPAIHQNTTIGVVVKSREASPDRSLLPSVPGRSRPNTGGSERDVFGRHAFAASPMHVRRAARVGVEGALIDRSPPKMDAATLSELERLKTLWDENELDTETYKERTKEVRSRWREAVRLPASPPKSQRWNENTRVSDDIGEWDVSMVEIGWGSRHATPLQISEGYQNMIPDLSSDSFQVV